MLSNLLSQDSVCKEYVNLADMVAYERPVANRTFDQIYMMESDMLIQLDIMQEYLKDKKVVFLGDGDGMSMLFGLFAARKIIPSPNSMKVLDFDERIVDNVKRFSSENGINKTINLDSEKYNVLDIITDENKMAFDFFYINPPYGSKNTGVSTEVWLHRCMDLCTYQSSGCIVIPYDYDQKWTIEAMIYIQKFLLKKGFVIRDMISYFHSYHLKDNPNLRSATLIVDRVLNEDSEYTNALLPQEMVINLYGSPRPIPRYIDNDGSLMGKPDYNWLYGKKFWL